MTINILQRFLFRIILGFPCGSVVKNLPASAEDAGLYQSQEDSLEKVMATHSSILAWEVPWTVEPARLQSIELQELDMT